MPTLEARGVELSWSEQRRGRARSLLVHETATSVGRLAAGRGARRRGRRARSPTTAAAGEPRRAPEGYRAHDDRGAERGRRRAARVARAAAPAVVCGAGIGAVIALDLLLRRPELVAGAVLVEPPLLALLPEATEALSRGPRGAAGGGRRPRRARARWTLYLSGGLGGARAPERSGCPTALTAAGARAARRSCSPSSGRPRAGACRCRGSPRPSRPSLIVTAPRHAAAAARGGGGARRAAGRQPSRARWTGPRPAARRRPGRRRRAGAGAGAARRLSCPSAGAALTSITPPRRASTAPPSSSTARIAVGIAARIVTMTSIA